MRVARPFPVVLQQATAEAGTAYTKPMSLRQANAPANLKGDRLARCVINRSAIIGTVALMGADLTAVEVGGGYPTQGSTSITRPTASNLTGHYDGERVVLSTALAVVPCARLTHAAYSAQNIIVRVHKKGFVSKAGTLSGTAGDHTLTGSSTQFLKELEAGFEILISGYRYHVAQIISATSMVLVEPLATSPSGTSYTGEEVQWLTYNASAAAGSTDDDWKVSSSSGLLELTFGCNRYTSDKFPAGTVIDIFKGTPKKLVDAATTMHRDLQIQACDVVWAVGTGGATSAGAQSATDVWLHPMIPG